MFFLQNKKRKLIIMKKLLYTFLLIPFLFSCDDDNFYNAQEVLEDDIEIIKQYVIDNNLDAIEDASGVFYVIEEEGTGSENPNSFAEISVAYSGYLTDGSQFDSATSVNPLNINLSQTISGWRFGIPKFKIGGKGKLIIPSPLGYANSARTGIPANSILVFDIELLDFTN